MGLKLYQEDDIQSIANAIRAKNGSSATYKTSQMASAINALNIASGICKGSFITNSSAGEQTISLNYSGTGYPVYLAIVVKTGFRGNTTYANLSDKGAVSCFYFSKSNWTLTPSYSGSGGADSAMYCITKKASAGQTVSMSADYLYRVSSPATDTPISLNNSTTLVLLVADSSTDTNHFPTNIEYEYVVVYSS